MLKSILVPTTEIADNSVALETALLVARMFGSHIDCCHVHPDRAQIMVQAAGFGFGMVAPSGYAMDEIVEAIESQDRRKMAAAQKIFDTFCKTQNIEKLSIPPSSHAPTAAWSEYSGREIDILVSQTRVHDLTVIAHPSQSLDVPRDFAGTLLVDGGRPLLLTPEKAPVQLGQTIAVAWKDSAESARAVAAAMPFLTKAHRVVLLSIAENENVVIESVEALAKSLRWHNVNTQVCYLANDSGTVQDTIIKMSRDEGADMLVMGGYGHSRTREFIFGGVTRHMLSGVEIPTLMVH